jgi:hypothetical protein
MGETFEGRDMAGAVFRDVNLEGAAFENVNLIGAEFYNVSLARSSIRNASLQDLTIDDANLKGLTISGLRIDLLIEDELDRRDPERQRLRMADRHDPESVLFVMEQLEEIRRGFYATLRAADPPLLVRRPAPGRWSAIENVRHLLFAEDSYLNRRILGNDEPLSKLGLVPAHLEGDPGVDDVGTEPCEELEPVLAAWDGAHARTRAYLAGVTPEELQRITGDAGTVGDLLQLLARHELAHIREAEALLAGAGST